MLLDQNAFTGTIPSHFGNLAPLTELLVHTNELTGEIPSEFGKLINLGMYAIPKRRSLATIRRFSNYLSYFSALERNVDVGWQLYGWKGPFRSLRPSQ